jgi:hypothetical protein
LVCPVNTTLRPSRDFKNAEPNLTATPGDSTFKLMKEKKKKGKEAEFIMVALYMYFYILMGPDLGIP